MILKSTQARETLQAGAGKDVLVAKHVDVTLIGGAGNDRYRVARDGVEIVETEDGGHDVVDAWRSISLADHVEDVTFHRTNGWHYVEGNDQNNKITAGEGQQALAGRGGNDILTGGGGADGFHFGAGDGHDVITDFDPEVDTLYLWGDVGDFDTLLANATETDEGVRLSLPTGDANSLLLQGLTIEALAGASVRLEAPGGPPEGAELTFAAEFDGLDDVYDLWAVAPLNTHHALVQTGSKREQAYVDNLELDQGNVFSPFAVTDGVLEISAQRAPEAQQEDLGAEWLSGSLNTRGQFAQTYGYFEISARLPEGQALWPAFWLVNENRSWPPEIDLIDVMGDETQVLNSAVQSGLWGTKVTSGERTLVPDMAGDFHVYGMLWTPTEVIFTFDGLETRRTATPADMHDPMIMILNLAIGGWNGASDDTTPEDAPFEIDYVRAYQIPGITDLPRATDQSDYADVEAGVLHPSSYGTLDLYGDEIRRATADQPSLALSATETTTLVGHAGANLLIGNGRASVMNGGAGNDTLIGGAGHDTLIGSDGDDVLEGGAGLDSLAGGMGDDTYVLRRGDGAAGPLGEIIKEQAEQGQNTLHFPDIAPEDIRMYVAGARLIITVLDASGAEQEYFAAKVGNGPDGHNVADYFHQITFGDGTVWDLGAGLHLQGNSAANRSAGTQFDDTMTGGAGDDIMAGMNGNDLMDGEAGQDDIYGWNGNDTLSDSGSEGGDRLFGEAGDDLITGGAGRDFLYGGTGDDTLVASADGDALEGGAGRDRLVGGRGADLLLGGEGHDWLSGGNGDDTLDGGAGRDKLRGGNGADVFQFQWGEINRDRIFDFDAGEGDRIEVAGLTDPAQVSVRLLATGLSITDLLSGQSAEIRASGVTLDDLILL
ncbi:MAG: hypothetical protein BM562_04935 [Alphaproteobacteria bacterium MedPE-SWcel]|nr:MAG: hypothetical protein BM562_04935 [Alphaproteobacteria bacterium MedPE-SWcel]